MLFLSQALNEGAGDIGTAGLFDDLDFGFNDDENLKSRNHSTESMEPNECEEEMPETAENLRRSAMAPPPGLYGGSPMFDERDSSFNLHLSDSDEEMGPPSASPPTRTRTSKHIK
jgi:hypothetical protein